VKKINLPPDVVKKASGLPPTRNLFHEDPYIREFKANVVEVIQGKYVVLDETAFYPEGGGQASDTGYLWIEGKEKARIINVQKVNGVIVHELEEPLEGLRKGIRVKGVIDWERRYVLMRHHTATHIILGVARKVLGEHVWQAGAEKTPKRARLDITHHKPLTKEEALKIEDMANMTYLNEASVLHNLRARYTNQLIYVSI